MDSNFLEIVNLIFAGNYIFYLGFVKSIHAFHACPYRPRFNSFYLRTSGYLAITCHPIHTFILPATWRRDKRGGYYRHASLSMYYRLPLESVDDVTKTERFATCRAQKERAGVVVAALGANSADGLGAADLAARSTPVDRRMVICRGKKPSSNAFR